MCLGDKWSKCLTDSLSMSAHLMQLSPQRLQGTVLSGLAVLLTQQDYPSDYTVDINRWHSVIDVSGRHLRVCRRNASSHRSEQQLRRFDKPTDSPMGATDDPAQYSLLAKCMDKRNVAHFHLQLTTSSARGYWPVCSNGSAECISRHRQQCLDRCFTAAAAAAAALCNCTACQIVTNWVAHFGVHIKCQFVNTNYNYNNYRRAALNESLMVVLFLLGWWHLLLPDNCTQFTGTVN